MSTLIYAIAFQLGWFVCIMAGNILSALYAIIFLIFHFWCLRQQLTSTMFKQELLWIITVTLAGFVIESLFFSASFLYSNAPSDPFEHFQLPPLWLLCLWLNFAIALRSCLAFLLYKPGFTYCLSLILIPLNYYAGTQLNSSVHINKPYFLSLSLITLVWIIFWWCLIQLKHHYFEE